MAFDFWAWLHELLVGLAARPGTEGVTVGLGSGFDKQAEEAERKAALDSLCTDLVTDPLLASRDVTGDGKAETFCNRAVQRAACAFGCRDFGAEGDPVLANEMVLRLQGGLPGWRQDTAERAAGHAMRGGLAIAAKAYAVHGHVAVVAPEPCQESGSWGKFVPMVANVGKPPNGIKKTSAAFPVADGEPDYFLYTPDGERA